MSEGDFNSDKFLERLRNRECEALEQLFQAMLKLLFPFIFRRLGRDPHRRQDAEDLVQETLFRAFLKISPLVHVGDFLDSASLIRKLRDGQDRLSSYLRDMFGPATRQLLDQWKAPNQPEQNLLDALVEELNHLLKESFLYEPTDFPQVQVSEETKELLSQKHQGKNLIYLNRCLLVDAYPYEIAKGHKGFEGKARIETWLCMIARRLIADYFEEKTVSLHFRVGDIRDAATLAVKLRDARDPLSEYLREQFSLDAQRLLKNFDGSPSQTKLTQRTLARELNRVVRDPFLLDEQRSAHITTSEETQRLIKPNQHAKVWELIRLNRLLLEDAYPGEIIRSSDRHVEMVSISELSDGFAFIEEILGSDGNLGIVARCEKTELLKIVESAINDWLEEGERYLLSLRYVYELTEREIAKEWRPQIVPVGTVTVTLMRVQKKLRRLVSLKLGVFRGLYLANEPGSSLIGAERLAGVAVKEVSTESTGSEAGIENRHKIKMVGDMPVHSVEECIAMLLPYVKASRDVTLTVECESKTMKIIVPGAARNGRGRG